MFNAMADPKTSYMSDPIIAISVISHSGKLTLFLNPFLHKVAISFPVTIPILAAST